MDEKRRLSSMLVDLLPDVSIECEAILKKAHKAEEEKDDHEYVIQMKEYIAWKRKELDIFEKGLESLENEIRDIRYPKPDK